MISELKYKYLPLLYFCLFSSTIVYNKRPLYNIFISYIKTSTFLCFIFNFSGDTKNEETNDENYEEKNIQLHV